MATTTDNSSMFSLATLTKEAAAVTPQPEEAPRTSLRGASFAPVLAAPVATEEHAPRVGGWVFVAAFVAFIAPVIGVVAFYETKTPHAATTTQTSTPTITETSERTIETTPTSTATQASPKDAPCTCMPPPPPPQRPRAIPTATATVTTVRHEAPKCCPGETEMQCAMRRSVGATCG